MDHPFRLRSVQLSDFKSVADDTVELGPLTVLVGANSAGKSTLLQAILAVTQAVKSETATPEFPLNGNLIRLGSFEETWNYLSQREVPGLEVAFELTDRSRRNPLLEFAGLEEDEDVDPRAQSSTRIRWHTFIRPVPETSSPDGDRRRGFAEIARLIMTTTKDSDDRTPLLECDIEPIDNPSSSGDISNLKVIGRRFRLGRPNWRATPVAGRLQNYVDPDSTPIDAVMLSGGIPHAVLKRTTIFSYLAEMWWAAAQEALVQAETSPTDETAVVTDDEDRPDLSKVQIVAPRTAATHIQEAITGKGPDAPRSQPAFGRQFDLDRAFSFRLIRLGDDEKDELSQSLRVQGQATFRESLRSELARLDRKSGEDTLQQLDEEVLLEQSGAAGESLARSGQTAQRFFSTNVEYLGPLREAPHVLYDPGPTQTDLGPEGKYTAAVLHAQADRPIVMPSIPGVAIRGRDQQRVPLNEALNAWLQWFGLADEAKANDRGRLGIGLGVVPEALGRSVDLTSVGVGVSQVLPVILLCLLARPGTLVIIEQPELHLHPRLQQDLADFLLACTESGRQLLIETHSEHLVNRLRRRVAADESDRTRALVKLVFAENREGITTYRESEINRYGGLDSDWPDGFLDLGAREAQALVKESTTKRKRDAGSETPQPR